MLRDNVILEYALPGKVGHSIIFYSTLFRKHSLFVHGLHIVKPVNEKAMLSSTIYVYYDGEGYAFVLPYTYIMMEL